MYAQIKKVAINGDPTKPRWHYVVGINADPTINSDESIN
jgi:hypothetical protein